MPGWKIKRSVALGSASFALIATSLALGSASFALEATSFSLGAASLALRVASRSLVSGRGLASLPLPLSFGQKPHWPALLPLVISTPKPWSPALPGPLEVLGGGKEAWVVESYSGAIVIGATSVLGPRSAAGASWRSWG
nr:hypothetical protein CFP56_40983 [Quercus suber]POE61379.1 hypothetical protein CFP56_40984 [Quercus suber]